MVNTLTSTDKPRISFNKICEFTHVTPSVKKRIAREQKYPADFQVSYYQPALLGLYRAIDLVSGLFDADQLRKEALLVESQPADSRYKKVRLASNVSALRFLANMAQLIGLPAGEHVKILQKAIIEREGVAISIRPEFITYNKQFNTFAFTKFRFSKSPVSADATETGVALLLEFAKEERFSDLILDLEQTTIVDVFSGTVIHGHSIGRHRLSEVRAALANLNSIWPDIEPPKDKSNRLRGPGE
jgi:hypothetical protein